MIEIDVERAAVPASLAEGNGARFFYSAPGDTHPIRLIANVAGGSSCDVNESTRVSYATSNPNVAMVTGTA